MIVGLRRVAQIMTWLAGGALITAAFLVSLEVALRKLFLVGLNAGTEISSYVLAVAASWGFGFTLLARGHVRVDALIRLLPLRLAAGADLLALGGLGIVAAMFLWYSWGTLAQSWTLNARSMTPLGVPLWIPQGLWVTGLLFFTFVVIVLFVRATGLLLAGRYAQSRRLIGMPEADEEAAETLAEVREMGAQADNRRVP